MKSILENNTNWYYFTFQTEKKRMPNKQDTFIQKILDRIALGEFGNGVYLPCERDLANGYGISRVTVRNGLKVLVSRRILRSVAKKGYMVLCIPGTPQNNSRNIGGLWCSGNFNQHTIDLYHSAETAAEQQAFSLFLNHTPDDDFQQAAHLSELMEEKINGLLIVPTYSRNNNLMRLGNHAMLSAILRSGIPLVMMDRDFPETDLPCVVNNEYAGGQLAAEHFAVLGHRSVMLICTDYNYYVAQRRFAGFMDRCRELGIRLTTLRIPYQPSFVDQDSLNSYLQRRKEILNLLETGDVSAVMINHICVEPILRDLKRIAPDFDFLLYDQKVENYPEDHVWCVERPLEEIASAAMDLLLDGIAKGGRGPHHQIRIRPVIRHFQNNKTKGEND